MCSRAVIIDQGRLVADGTPEELLSRAADHNAVVVSVDADRKDALLKGLDALDGIKSIKTSQTRDGCVSLRIRPKNSGLIATDVAAVIRSAKIPVREMFVDRGSLDDVFRKITTRKTSAGCAG